MAITIIITWSRKWHDGERGLFHNSDDDDDDDDDDVVFDVDDDGGGDDDSDCDEAPSCVIE